MPIASGLVAIGLAVFGEEDLPTRVLSFGHKYYVFLIPGASTYLSEPPDSMCVGYDQKGPCQRALSSDGTLSPEPLLLLSRLRDCLGNLV